VIARRLKVLMALLVFAGGIAAAAILAQRAASPQGQSALTAPAQRPHARRLPVQRVPGAHNRPVPILMYHVLAPAPTNAIFAQLFVPPAEFAAQVDWLSTHGYHAVTLQRVFAYWRRGIPLPPKPIVLTFDDGYLSDYTVALPILRRHHWPGVLDLVVRNLVRGDIEPWQVRRLMAAGWEIDAHTVSHVDLTRLDSAHLREEVAGARRALRRIFDKPIAFFCYPLGHYDDRVIAAVKAAGFRGATTEQPGLARASEVFTLARIRIEPGDGMRGLIDKLRRYGADPTPRGVHKYELPAIGLILQRDRIYAPHGNGLKGPPTKRPGGR
jgi:peptidoglycan/xylan/chitin deacetylase (PgdA/CDA1 family)